ncbi:aldo/keto reductase [Hydrogenobacter sp. T-2]|uniref:aldo/keto reductase n=1 Tax=Pampinifervens diazotrophicum TaxID=1632018 RepID=UPI002B25E962|nr:aldo/keto reductase [Hydrogenobacter sp. T-2]WPM31839.1 aldo/keto reductase [Hydrogenobacter sp. T-2]
MKNFLNLELSELGVGTYLGELDQRTSQGYKEVIKTALQSGINVVDTAIVYRYMKSERDIGEVLREVPRDKVIVSTKGGYVPYDVDSGIDPKDYFYENFVNTGIIKLEEMTPQGHYLSAKFIEWCLNKSLENMNTDYVDIYFLHNPEEQLNFFDRKTFNTKIRECFEYLESEVKRGRVRYYGLATWGSFRVSPASMQYLNLSELLSFAEEVAGQEHHFRFIQLPYNLGMPEAYTLKNQEVKGQRLSTLEACERLGVYTYISASIYQGRVIGRVPEELKQRLKVEKDVHASLQFVLSTPGVGTALVGMSKLEHLEENLQILSVPRLSEREFLSLFK